MADSLIAFILAVWSYWVKTTATESDWTLAARITLELLFPSLLLNRLLQDIERLEPIAIEEGISIQATRCKM